MVIDVEPAEFIEINGSGIIQERPLVVDHGSDVDNNNRHHADIVGEEGFRRRVPFQRPHTQVELDDDEQDAPEETPPGADGVSPGLPRQLRGRPALDLPGVSHAEMRRADHAPAEESKERGEVGEPAEDGGTAVADVQVGQATADDQGEDQTGPGTTGFVCMAKELSQSESARSGNTKMDAIPLVPCSDAQDPSVYESPHTPGYCRSRLPK